MSVRVLLAPDAQVDFDALPRTVAVRVLAVFRRLEQWPDISGVKWLHGELAGQGRIRVGDWRVLFRFVAPTILVVRIRHRSQVYE